MLERVVPFRTCSDISVSLLGAVERQLVMNLLWLESSILTTTMSSWVTKEGKTWGSYPLFHLVRSNYVLCQAFRRCSRLARTITHFDK